MNVGKMSNKDIQQTQDLEHANTHGTYLDKEEVTHLSEAHRNYLIQKHGTIELEPIPTMSDADPYNWPVWKVSTCLVYLLKI